VSEIPGDRGYTKEHEWARQDDGRVVVGITDYAQDQLGDVVFVRLPEVGSAVTAGQPLGEVESTKSVSDVYSPVSGTVVEANTAVESNPELVNEDPYDKGWLVAVDTGGATLEGLMTADDYRKLVESGG
jgi:glycine cleavage system H protein